ncbi:MAG: metallophosphoesterase [Patescibacteria group bacterium]|jgi:predicted phosphodiesterase
MASAKNKIDVDTLIISDTHLGDDSARCQKIIELLNTYRFKKLILNGDIVDGVNFQRFHSDHWQVFSVFRRLSKYHEVIWVHGNHDGATNIISRLLGINTCNKYIWENGGKKFLAIHGHQYDRFMNNNAVISYLAFAFYSFLKKVDKTELLVKFIGGRKRWLRNSLGVENGAVKYGKNLGVDYVFCGHTHQIYHSKKEGIEYFNTGCWVEDVSGYVIIKKGEVNQYTV